LNLLICKGCIYQTTAPGTRLDERSERARPPSAGGLRPRLGWVNSGGVLITADACRPLNDHEYRKRDIGNRFEMPGDAMQANRRATI